MPTPEELKLQLQSSDELRKYCRAVGIPIIRKNREEVMEKSEEHKRFVVNYEECQKQIVADVVCNGCGGPLSPIETVDNSGTPTHWVGCEHCLVFTHGCDFKVWEIARALVMIDGEWRYQARKDYETSADRLEYWLDTETRGMTDSVRRILYLAENRPTLPNTAQWLRDNVKLKSQ